MLVLLLLDTIHLAGPTSAVAFVYVVYASLDREGIIAVPKKLAAHLLPLLLLFFVGLLGFFSHGGRDFSRDAWYFLNPMVLIAAGSLWYARNRQLGDLIDMLSVAGFAALLDTLYLIYANSARIALNGSIDYYRDVTGHGVLVTVVAIIAISLAKENGFRSSAVLRNKVLRRVVYGSCLVCTALFLSRIFSLCLLLFYFSQLLRLRLRYLAGMVLLVGIVAFGTSIYSAQDSDSLVGKFFTKFYSGESELSTSHRWTEQTINENWRGYESYRVRATFDEFSLQNKIIGGGFGQLVDLGIVMNLGKESYTHIPLFHSGYNYLVIKTGILGTAMFVWFFAWMWRIGWVGRSASDPEQKTLYQLVLWSVILILLSQVAAPGFYAETTEASAVILLGTVLSL